MIKHFIDLKDTRNAKKWDEFVVSNLYGTPYHLTTWLNTLEETYGFKPLHICFKDKNNEIEVVFPLFTINNIFQKNRAVSIPFSDYGGPITSNTKPLSQLFINNEIIFSSGIKNLECRCPLPGFLDFNGVANYYRHYLDLEKGIDLIEKNVDKKTIRYSIRKAIKHGVQIREDNSEKALYHFIRLNELTRAKHKVPAQPKQFFKNIYKNIVQQNRGYFLIAEHQGIVTAASLFLLCGDIIHYKYSASDPSVFGTVSPNHLLTWTAIQNSILKGYKKFDFGRTSTDNSGLVRYKRMWGCNEIEWDYSYYPEVCGASSIKESSPKYQLLIKTWDKLPKFLKDIISLRMYKYLG